MSKNDYSIPLDSTKDELERWLVLWRARQSHVSPRVNGQREVHQHVSESESKRSSVGFHHDDDDDADISDITQTPKSKEVELSAGFHHEDDDDGDFIDIITHTPARSREGESSASCNPDTDEDDDVDYIDLVSKSNKKRSAMMKETPSSQKAQRLAKKPRHDTSGPRSSVSWTDKEIRALIAGVRTRNGTFNWTTLKREAGDDLKNRTNVDIKYKWLAFLSAALKVARTKEEARVIDKVGFKKGRLDWYKIYKDTGLPLDHSLRTNVEHTRDAFWRNVDNGIQAVLEKESRTGQASCYQQGRWII
jgi:hypothetical protein